MPRKRIVKLYLHVGILKEREGLSIKGRGTAVLAGREYWHLIGYAVPLRYRYQISANHNELEAIASQKIDAVDTNEIDPCRKISKFNLLKVS